MPDAGVDAPDAVAGRQDEVRTAVILRRVVRGEIAREEAASAEGTLVRIGQQGCSIIAAVEDLHSSPGA
jgi:hypothetical protein